MAETMPLEMRALALEQPWSLVRGARSWKNVDIPTEVDSAAAAAELAWYKAAATWGGKPKSASWNDVPLFFFPDSAANKVEVKTKPAAHKVEIKTKPAAHKVEIKSKAASVTFFIEPAAIVEDKEASAGFVEPAASLEGKTKPAARVECKTKLAAASSIEWESESEDEEGEEAEPKVLATVYEEVPFSSIQRLLDHPPRRPRCPPEGFFERFPELRETTLAANSRINLLVDVKEDILKQYHAEGKAVVKVEILDNGLKKLCRRE
ncbi:unnamed protein product [Urochloa decumbens]|uniref:Uncharacterized protein n=1 Tax=Urochloa decumbens TaxID=240449 RepID=A0ABC9AST8_9POAL